VAFRAVSDDGLRKKLFEEYVAHLVQKAKEKDRKREKEEKVSPIGLDFQMLLGLALVVVGDV